MNSWRSPGGSEVGRRPALPALAPGQEWSWGPDTWWYDADGRFWRRGPCSSCGTGVVTHQPAHSAGWCEACGERAVARAREEVRRLGRWGR